MGALSFRFDGENCWSSIFNDFFDINLDKIPNQDKLGVQNKNKLGEKLHRFLVDVSVCLGIKRQPCFVRPNGFNVIPDGTLDRDTIIKYLVETLKKSIGAYFDVKMDLS
jgi:hypothetical protein